MATYLITTLEDEMFAGTETVGSPDGTGLSLREALGLAAADIVRFSNGLAGGTLNLDGAAAITLSRNVVLDGDTDNDGEYDITVQSDVTLFRVDTDGASLTSDGVRILLDKSANNGGSQIAVNIAADGASFINRGVIETVGYTSEGSQNSTIGLQYNGDNFTFLNETDSSITGGKFALDSGYLYSTIYDDFFHVTGTSIVNHGLLEASDDAIRIPHGEILNSGVIRTTGVFDYGSGAGQTADGISAFGFFSPGFDVPVEGLVMIANTETGLIEGVRAGVYITGGGVINNAGAIVGDSTGIYGFGTDNDSPTRLVINNSGLIERLEQGVATTILEADRAAISLSESLDLISATITNSGLIQSTDKAINSFTRTTILNEVGGVIRGDSDSIGDDAVAFRGAALEDFEAKAQVTNQSIHAGMPIVTAQDVTVVGPNTFQTPVGVYSIPGGGSYTPVASLYGRIAIDAPPILPLIDFAATQGTGSIFFVVDPDVGEFIFPNEIEVPVTGYGVLTVRRLEDWSFSVEDAQGNPVYFLPDGISFDDRIENFGEIYGDILTGAGDDYLLNNGLIVGDIDLGSGNDSANGGDGDDSIDGGLGDDYLVGSTGSDTISGDDGDDLIYGGSGNDVLFGGAGEEYISGGVNNDIIDGGDGDDELAGGANNDSVMGGDGNDLIYGAKKVDTLEGGAGNDTISGAADNDFIDGGADDDTLFGGRQNDLITGGTGNDLFLYNKTNDYDVITDFTAGAGSEDVIQLNNFGAAFDTFAEVMAAAVEITGDTYIDFGDGDIIILQGVLIADLHQDDFTFG